MSGVVNSEKPSSRRRLVSRLFPSESQTGLGADALPGPSGLLEPALVLIMVGSLATAIADFIRLLDSGWGTYLIMPLVVLASVEALAYWARLNRTTFQPREWLVLLLPLALVAKFGPYIPLGLDRLLADAWSWWRSPFDFFDMLFVITCLLLVASFRLTLDFVQDLSGLRVQPGELIVRTSSVADSVLYSRADYIVDHLAPLRRLGERFLWGGALLVLLCALTAVDPAQLLTLEGARDLLTFARPPVTASFASVIVYFAAGLLLMVRSQFLRRQTLWQVEEVPYEANIGRRWHWFGFGLLAAMVALALLLPVYYSLAFNEAFGAIMSAFGEVFMGLATVAYLLLSLLLWPLRFLRTDAPPSAEPATKPEAPPPPDKAGGVVPDFLLPLLFWLAVLVIVVYVARVIWLRRRVIRTFLPRRRSWRQLWSALRELLRLFWRASRALGQAVGSNLASLVGRAGPTRLTLVLSHRPFRSMGPRELVQYFYASMVEHASRQGLPRHPDQTPWEYAASLRKIAPDLEPELEQLTDSFLWARYSHHHVGPEHSSHARRSWLLIRQKLKARSRRQTFSRSASS